MTSKVGGTISASYGGLGFFPSRGKVDEDKQLSGGIGVVLGGRDSSFRGSISSKIPLFPSFSTYLTIAPLLFLTTLLACPFSTSSRLNYFQAEVSSSA